MVSARDAASALWSSVQQLPAPGWLDDAAKRTRDLAVALQHALDGSSWPLPTEAGSAYDQAGKLLRGTADLEVAAIRDLNTWMNDAVGGSVSHQVARWSGDLGRVPPIDAGGNLVSLAEFLYAAAKVLNPVVFRAAERQVSRVQGDIAAVTRGAHDRVLRQAVGRFGEAEHTLGQVTVRVEAGNRALVVYLHSAIRTVVEACTPLTSSGIATVNTAVTGAQDSVGGRWAKPDSARSHGKSFNAVYEIYVHELAAHLSGEPGRPGLEYVAVGNDKQAWMDAVWRTERAGVSVEILIDAKGRHAQFLDQHGDWKSFFAAFKDKGKGLPGLIDRAGRQVRASGGRPVEWWCAELEVARSMNREFARFRHLDGRVKAVWKPFPEDTK
jgi:hypothetical protein